ncbi:MAG: acetylxylan esterase [Thermoleophilales bacterium]|nr:acetylxylan esterase [Thermoleophilales bacterium]
MSTAQAAPTSVFDGAVSCTTQGPGDNEGQTWCGSGKYNQNADIRSTVKSFDGVPVDVNVAFPDEATSGTGPYPLVYMFHGYGGGKVNFSGMQHWLDKGYAVFSQTNRGFHESCGTATSKVADPVCGTKGFVRLDDSRYEVRDAQLFAGMLVDEGLVLPTKIAATGGSYGGGMSMALAALKDRVMLPDGTYEQWKSPDGTPMSLAVAIPDIPWTDLAYSLVPNGSNIDYIKDASYYGPFGVMKQSYVNGLYLSGLTAPGYYTPAGEQPEADLAGWKAFMDAGEPYEGEAAAEQMLTEVTTHHSSYYIDHSQAPAPLLISSGFTDDLFPANEATRFYNRTRAQYPNSPIGLFFGSFGHMRGQNGSEVVNDRADLQDEWIDYYLKGTGTQPASNVTTWTQVCPDGDMDGGPYTTDDWVDQSPGEITLQGDAAQTIEPGGGDRAVGAAWNPAPSGKACTSAAGAEETGIANYNADPAPAGGYTVMGSPTVIAKYTYTSNDPPQVAARLVDVSADGTTKTLVNRGIWRLNGTGFQVFQLNPNGWHVDEGHYLRLELLPFDGGQADAATGTLANFGRPTNNQPAITVEDLQLRIPVREQPGAVNGLVKAPVKRVLPDRPDVALAPGNEAIGSQTVAEYVADAYPCPEGTSGPGGGDCTPNPVIGKIQIVKATVKGKTLTARVKCAGSNDSCAKATVKFKGAPKKGKKGRGVILAKKSGVTAAAGKTVSVRFNLTGKARKLFRDSKKRKVVRKHGRKKVKYVKVKGLKSLRSQVLVNGKGSGYLTVKRTGKVK